MRYRVELVVEDEPWDDDEEEPMAYILYILQSAIDGSPELRLVDSDIERED